MYEWWSENTAAMRDFGPFASLPWGIRHLTGIAIGGFSWLMLYFQGTGRHKPDELKALRQEAIAALSDYAEAAYAKSEKDSNRPFWILGGEKPTEADFTLFGYLAAVMVSKA